MLQTINYMRHLSLVQQLHLSRRLIFPSKLLDSSSSLPPPSHYWAIRWWLLPVKYKPQQCHNYLACHENFDRSIMATLPFCAASATERLTGHKGRIFPRSSLMWVHQPPSPPLSTYLTHPHLMKEMKLKILGSPLPTRVEDGEMEMDTLGPPQPPAAVMERKKSRVGWVSIALLSFPTPELPCSLHLAFVSFPHVERDSK